MPNPASPSLAQHSPGGTRQAEGPAQLFFGVLDPVLVEAPAEFAFAGAIWRPDALAAWDWVMRELSAGRLAAAGGPGFSEDWLPEIVERMRAAVPGPGDHEGERRMRVQLGGEDHLLAFPAVIAALKARSLIANASAFGRAINTLPDGDPLVAALRAVPLSDKAQTSLMMQAAIGQVANPSRLVVAAIRLSGSPTELSLMHAGLAPMIDAMLCHAQNQIPGLSNGGAFADADLACRRLERFHRLMRAVAGYVELGRQSRWSRIIAGLSAAMSERIEPYLLEVPTNLSQALKIRPNGADRVDADLVLATLNGFYLMLAARDCRDSLAVNAVCDQVWSQTGQMLELLLTRALDALRLDPENRAARSRLEAGIAMAELRFNSDYADVLRRAMEAAERRPRSA